MNDEMLDARELTPLELNKIRFSTRHTPLTPSALGEQAPPAAAKP